MISIALLLFGLFSGCLLCVLVGMIGKNRKIGFGWAFILSLILTPLFGLLLTLLSDPLPSSQSPRWGCLGTILGILGVILLIPFIAAILMLLGVTLFTV